MKDKDKLILCLKIGAKNLGHEAAKMKINRTYAFFENKFDDSVIVLPLYTLDNGDVDINVINTENFTKEEVDDIVEKSRKMIEGFNKKLF